jgi:diguanylate cyclase (GGDEF)-like protein/PAS domain S-box-containing protein
MVELHVLFIEDSEDDMLLLLRELRSGGYNVHSQRVQDAESLHAALESGSWDLILCDFSLPSMNALQALEVIKNRELEMPFMVISGAIDEESAVSALKAGAHDFLTKHNLSRFLPAVQRELKETENRRLLKQADANLRTSEERFRSTLDSMLEGCQIIGFDWRYLYLNDAAVKHSKFRREELIGRTMMECYPDIEGTALFNGLRMCMQQRSSYHMVNEFRYPDGSRGWFELYIQPAPEGLFVLSSDITARKLAEQSLLEREMKLTILLEILPVGISILDKQGQISFTNPALQRILDISSNGLHNGAYANRTYLRPDGSPMPAEERASTRALNEKREVDDVETGVVREDGTITWTNVSAVPVDLADWDLVLVTSDITGRKRAEEEVLKLNAVLEAKVAERTAELAAANEQLYQLSLFDPLTGLYNRRGFQLVAEKHLQLAQRSGRNLLAFYGDLDGLKMTNDQLGHGAGDDALVAAAKALNETFRASDIKARLGGDEFIVLALETEERDAQALLGRLHQRLAGKNQTLTMSMGVVSSAAPGINTIDDLIARADEAMYAQKRRKPGSRSPETR